MRLVLLTIFFLYCLGLLGQDKIYLLNGEMKECAVKEIGPEMIKFFYEGEMTNIETREVLLLEFANGQTEVINKPKTNIIYIPAGSEDKRHVENVKSLISTNYISLNTLALINSDISVFYEKLLIDNNIGLGFMGAYNFNNYAGVANVFIATLGNAKKNYDLGLTFNYYLSKLQDNNTFYLGILFKYTSIKFDRTIVSGGGGNVTYVPKTGSQLSTIFTCGHFHKFSNNWYIKTIYGLGGFNLKGDYQKEFNSVFTNSNNQPGNWRFLPKIYLGINFGFNF